MGLFVRAGNVTIDVVQHTEGRMADSRSMLDLTVYGLDNEEQSIGGWFGSNNGWLDAGKAPDGCQQSSMLFGLVESSTSAVSRTFFLRNDEKKQQRTRNSVGLRCC